MAELPVEGPKRGREEDPANMTPGCSPESKRRNSTEIQVTDPAFLNFVRNGYAAGTIWVSSRCRILSFYCRSSAMCMCVCVFFPFILDIKFVGRTSRGHTGGRSHRILIHLLSAVRALIFLARRIQPFLSLVDREVEFCIVY